MEVNIIKRIISILIVFLVSMMVFAPSASAWSSPTHEKIATTIYNHLSAGVRAHLNLSEMQRGAYEPDTEGFKNKSKESLNDPNIHRYPATVNKTIKWISKAEKAYAAGNYNDASYDIGVASHYIADTGCAVHSVHVGNISHHLYENQATKLTPKIDLSGIKRASIADMLKNEYKEGPVFWNNWKNSRKDSIQQTNLNKATSVAYILINRHIK